MSYIEEHTQTLERVHRSEAAAEHETDRGDGTGKRICSVVLKSTQTNIEIVIIVKH